MFIYIVSKFMSHDHAMVYMWSKVQSHVNNYTCAQNFANFGCILKITRAKYKNYPFGWVNL